jgi:diacylglycerol kinase family enzyme
LANALGRSASVSELDFARLDELLRGSAAYERVVVAGGDGTVSAVLGHPALPARPVGVIPLGTANDLCRELGILRALRFVPVKNLPAVLETWTSRRVAVWELSMGGKDITFTNYCSFGFEGSVIDDFCRWRSGCSISSRFLNRAMYAWFGARRLGQRLDSVRVESGEHREAVEAGAMSVIITNLRSYMGLANSNTKSDPGDDKLEYVVTKSVLDYVRMFLPGFLRMSSTCRELSPPLHVHSSSQGIHVQVDGEYLGNLDSAGIAIRLKRHVEILAP